MRKLLAIALALTLVSARASPWFCTPPAQQDAPDAAAMAVLAKIRDEGLHRSQVEKVFDMFVNVIGPRLTGSPAHKRAADYARDTMDKWGLTNSHLESWEFGRGWSLEKLTIEMVEPRYAPLVGYAEAWTPSTKGELIVDAVSVVGKSPEEVEAMKLDGAAVMQQPALTSFIADERPQPALLPDDATYRTGAPAQGGGNRGAAAAAAATSAAAGARRRARAHRRRVAPVAAARPADARARRPPRVARRRRSSASRPRSARPRSSSSRAAAATARSSSRRAACRRPRRPRRSCSWASTTTSSRSISRTTSP